MQVAVLATGGKDSTLALHKVLEENYEVTCLASIIPLREDSWMFHFPNICLVDLFAEAVDIPLVKAESSGAKEKEVVDLKKLIENLNVDGVVSGAIASDYQKTRIDNVCKQLGMRSIVPLWHRDPEELLNELLTLEFEVMITGVYAYGFDSQWLGKKINAEVVQDLVKLNKRYGVSLVGEGGEYETLVIDGPVFKKRIKITSGEKTWKGQSGYFTVSEARLESK